MLALTVANAVPDPGLADWMKRELQGETVLWVARPDASAFAFHNSMLGVAWVWVLIQVPMTVVYFLGHPDSRMVDQAPTLIGVVLTVVVLLTLWHFYKRWRARFTRYVLTARRAVIFRDVIRRKVLSQAAETIIAFDCDSDDDGHGRVSLYRPSRPGSRFPTQPTFTFVGLEDVARVARVLESMVAPGDAVAASRGPSPEILAAVASPPRPDLVDRVRREVGDERVLWAGKPPRRGNHVMMIFMMLFGFGMSASAIVVILQFASHSGVGVLAEPWTFPMILFGGVLVMAILLWRSLQAYQVVTSRRTITFEQRYGFPIHARVNLRPSASATASAPTDEATKPLAT